MQLQEFIMKDQHIVETPKIKADTLCHVILDMSGSMSRLASATREGLNTYLQTLKDDKSDDEVLVSVTVFDSDGWSDNITVRIDTILDMVPLNAVPEITEDHYKPRGGTPMYDAIGTAVERTELALEGVTGSPEVLLVVITDGDENTSQTFKQGQIKTLLEMKEGQGWSTIYLGANQDAWAVGSSIGINAGNVRAYAATIEGIKDDVFTSVANATTAYRADKLMAKSIGAGDGYVTRAFFAGDSNLAEEEILPKDK